MSYRFDRVASCDLFALHLNEQVPGKEHWFPLTGEPVGDLVRPRDIPVQLSGHSRAEYADGTVVDYVGFCVPYPFEDKPLLYPPGLSKSVALEPGRYACFTAKVPLDFEMLTEPATRELDAGTCIVCLTGTMKVNGAELEPLQIAQLSSRKSVTIESSEPVFIVRAR